MTKASHEAIEIVKTVFQTRIVRVWLGIVSRRLLKILFIQNSVVGVTWVLLLIASNQIRTLPIVEVDIHVIIG